jgi:protoheme IX farnesyltransferase
MLRAYYELMKPRVMYGNLITTMAGFLFASKGDIAGGLFVAVSTGTALVISSACVINNYLDQDIDALMSRTKKRPLITGEVSQTGAVLFGAGMGMLGLVTLAAFTNWWVVGSGVFGWIVYVWLYGALGKRKSVHGTLVGSISGAVPILAGYVAVTNGLDLAAVILFMILFIWQMPEFYSIAIYRRDEYKKAGVPVISVVRGISHAKREIMAYLIAFFVAVTSLAFAGYTGYTYLVLMSALSLYWLWLGYKSLGASPKDDARWSRRVFHYSLIVLLVFSLLISVNSWLP